MSREKLTLNENSYPLVIDLQDIIALERSKRQLVIPEQKDLADVKDKF